MKRLKLSFIYVVLGLSLFMLASCQRPIIEEYDPVISQNNAIFNQTLENDIAFEIDLKGGTFVSISGANISNQDYSWDDPILTINITYLRTLTIDTHQLTFVTTTGQASFTIEVMSGIVHPSWSYVTSNVFHQELSSEFALNVDLKGSTFLGIKKDNVYVNQTHYLFNQNVLTMHSSYLNSLSILGEHQFSIVTTTGEAVFSIVINDVPLTQAKEMIKFPNEAFSNESLSSYVTNQYGTFVYEFDDELIKEEGTLFTNPTDGTFSFNPTVGFVGEMILKYRVVDQYGAHSLWTDITIIYKEVKPIIYDSERTFDKRYPSDIVFNVNRKGIEENAPDLDFRFIFLNDIALDAINYVFDKVNNRFTIKQSYLMGLDYDTYIFTLQTDGGTEQFEITITDTRIPTATPASGNHIKESGLDYDVVLELYGASQLQLHLNETLLTHEIDYTFSGNTLVLLGIYLETLPLGSYVITMTTEFAQGTLTINVVANTNPPSITQSELILHKTVAMDDETLTGDNLKYVTLTYKLKSSETYQSVLASHYQTSDQEIILSADFFEGLDLGLYDVRIQNAYGMETITLVINDQPIVTDKEMIKLPNESFTNETFGSHVQNSIGELVFTYIHDDLSMYGNFTSHSNGTFSFTPLTGWYGQFEVDYYVTDAYDLVSETATITIIYKEVKPIIYDSERTFDKRYPSDIVFNVNRKGIEENAPDLDFRFIFLNDIALDAINYVFDKVNNRFTIKQSYLMGLDYDTYIFTLQTDGGTEQFEITITDTRIPTATPASGNHIKESGLDYDVVLELYGASQLQLHLNETLLTHEIDYTFSGNTLVLLGIYLETLPLGSYVITMTTEFAQGTLTINVVANTNPPSITQSELILHKTVAMDDETLTGDNLKYVTLTYKLKSSETYQSVLASHYQTSDQEIILSADFFEGLDLGLYDVRIQNAYGMETITLVINDQPIVTDKEMIKLPNESFTNETFGSHVQNSIGELVFTYIHDDLSMYGNFTSHSNGTFSFTPLTGWYGQFEVDYYVTDAYDLVSETATITIIYKEVKPYFSTTQFSFDKNGGENLSIPYQSQGNPSESVSYAFVKLELDDTVLTRNIDFTLIGENIILLASSHLSTLPYGEYAYTLYTEGGFASFTLTVLDSRAIAAIPLQQEFLQSNPLNCTFTLVMYDKLLTSVQHNQTNLVENQDYTFVHNSIVFSSAYLLTLPVGVQTFVINGTTSITIVIKTDNAVTVSPDDKEIVINRDDLELEAVVVSVQMQGYEASTTVTGSDITSDDYIISTNQITLSSTFVNSKTYGIYTFTIDNGSGEPDDFTLVFGGKPIEASHPDGQTIVKFTNELISNEALRVTPRQGQIVTVTLVDGSEITNSVGLLTFNQDTKQFTFIRETQWWGIAHFSYQVTDSYGFTSDVITMTLEYKPLHPTIADKDDKEYYKQTGIDPLSNIVYTVTETQGMALYLIEGNDISNQDYVLNGNMFTIYSTFLTTLEYGYHLFELYTTGGKETFTIHVLDDVPPVIEPDALVFEKAALIDTDISIQMHGNAWVGMYWNDVLLVETVDYDYENNNITLKVAFLETLDYGQHTLTMVDTMQSATLDILIRDDLAPQIIEATEHYVLNSNEQVVLTLDLFGNTLLRIGGNEIEISDYSIENNTITIDSSYLNGLEELVYTFTIDAGYGTFEASVTYQLEIRFVPEEPMIEAINATFDLDNPDDITFSFTLNDYTFNRIEGNGISVSDYQIAAGILTIQKSYLQYYTKAAQYELTLYADYEEESWTTALVFDVFWENETHKIINAGFETGDLFGWNAYGVWKDEYGITAWRDERVVATSNYGSSGLNPYNKDGNYHLGVYAEPYSSESKDRYQEAMGMLRSSNFILGGSGWISFKLGGGQNQATAYVSIRDAVTNIEVARFGNRHFNNTTLSQTSNAEAYMFQYYYNLSAYLGESLYVMISDMASHEWSVLAVDSFITYYNQAPTPDTDQLAVNILPNIYMVGSATNQMINTLSSNTTNWEDPQGILQWTDGRARTNKTCGDGCLGAIRSPAFTIDLSQNTHIRWEWEGNIQLDKQLFVLVKEVGTNFEVLRLVRRANLSTKSSGGFDNHWYDLSSLNPNKEYYLEFVDNTKSGWGLISIKDVELVGANHARVQVADDMAVNTYYGHAMVTTEDGRHRFSNPKFSYIETDRVFAQTTSLGEDPTTQINIQYHSYSSTTIFEYTLASDLEFLISTEVVPTTVLFDEPDFLPRYVSSVELTNLLPNQTYIYRIRDRISMSDTYQFNTLSQSEPLSFIFMTDIQALSLQNALIYRDMMDVAIDYNDEVSFALISGDIVERGGNPDHWDWFYESLIQMRSLPIVSVPGNHDYYLQDGVLRDQSYFNAFFNHPDNGPEDYVNSSYFFVTHDTLFIMLDVVTNAYGSNQIDWVEDVIANHPTTFIVVSMHYSPYGSTHTTTAADVLSTWGPIFDANQVDLVISGHDHVYARTPQMMNGVVSSNPNEGTVYIIGGSAGHKLYTVPEAYQSQYEYYMSVTQSTIHTISIDNETITFTALNALGEIVDQLILNAKDKEPMQPMHWFVEQSDTIELNIN